MFQRLEEDAVEEANAVEADAGVEEEVVAVVVVVVVVVVVGWIPGRLRRCIESS